MNDLPPFNRSKRVINKKIEEMFEDSSSFSQKPKLPKETENNLLIQLINRKGLLVFGLVILAGWSFFFLNYFSKPKFTYVQLEKYWEWDGAAPIISTPIITDINKDNSPDLIFADNLGYLQALNPEKKQLLYQIQLGSSVIAPLATVDVDGEDALEVLVATENGKFFTINQSGNYLYQSRGEFFHEAIFAKPVSLLKSFFLAGMKGRIWAVDSRYGEVIWINENSPLIGQKIFPSLLYAEVENTPMLFASSEEGGIIGIDAKSGALVWEKKLNDRFKSSLLWGQFLENKKAILITSLNGIIWLISPQGEILAKGKSRETFISTSAKRKVNDKLDEAILASESGKLFIAKIKTSSQLPHLIELEEIFNQQEKFISSPVVFDLDQDKIDDILIIGREGNLYLINGKDYSFFFPPYPLNVNVTSTPLVADINGDRNLEIIIGSEIGKLIFLSLKTSPKPMFKKYALIYTQFLKDSYNQN